MNKAIPMNKMVPVLFSYITVRKEKFGGFCFNPFLLNEIKLNQVEMRVAELCNGEFAIGEINSIITKEFHL